MKTIAFHITRSNFSRYVSEILEGRTSFPTVGYVFQHDNHPGRTMAFSHTIRVHGKHPEGWVINKHLWALYDVDSGFRIVTEQLNHYKTRKEAHAKATEVLSTISPEDLRMHLEEKTTKLAKYALRGEES